MAVKNMSRDNNAKDISKEVSYMYLSHFIDIRDGIKEYVDDGTRTTEILEKANIPANKRAQELTIDELKQIHEVMK